MELIFWQNAWYILFFTAFAVFLVLDGSDLGAGMLMPFFKNDKESRQALLEPVTPFWDGNEIWLIIALSAMFAAFPPSFTTLLSSGFLPLLVVMLFLGMRSVAFGFLYHGGENPGVWEFFISASSIIITIGFFLGFGTMLNGFELNAKYEILDGIGVFFTPVALCTALAGFALFAYHGTAYQLHRGKTILRERMFKLLKPFSIISSTASLLLEAVLIAHKPELFSRPLFLAGAALAIIAPLVSLIIFGRIGGRKLYIVSSASIAGLWLMIGSALYPAIVPSLQSEAMSMTIFNTSTSLNGLSTLAVILIPFYIIISIYTIFVHTRFTNTTRRNKQL
jgi:cytochrome bd ubiquinol oxidase subunit II